MKNAQSKFAQTLGTHYQSRNRLLLTGTPLQARIVSCRFVSFRVVSCRVVSCRRNIFHVCVCGLSTLPLVVMFVSRSRLVSLSG